MKYFIYSARLEIYLKYFVYERVMCNTVSLMLNIDYENVQLSTASKITRIDIKINVGIKHGKI